MQKTLVNLAHQADNDRVSVETSGAGAETPDTALTTDAAKDRDDMADPDSTSGKAPAFQFYPKDFLSDSNVVGMSMQERGVYITLICICWQDHSIPADVAQLARQCSTPLRAFQRIWPAVEKCFRKSGASRLVHPRLERERMKQADYRRRQSDASRKRWDKPEPSQRIPKPGIPTAVPKPSSALSDLQSASASAERNSRASLSPGSDPSLSDRAGAFLERYQALYTKHRGGAHYHHRPIDFQHALGLCRTWPDDARLDKIAVVFLTTDHKFAEEGSRTVGQMAALASWCDDRITKAGIA